MNSKMLKLLRAAIFVPLTAVSLASAAQAQTAKPAASSANMPMGGMQSGAGGSADMKQSMMSGMDSMQKMQMSGDTDKDFATMMKIHHQGAIDMAQMELAHGKSPIMKAMAKNIIAAQKKEIAKFDRWLSTQK
ncbi:DUF305 domain-containing protein [Variovorax sp. RT4R15]|uniref:DUF305 domain-containing protein n=1 Tax=Variovorax sp. RT4R15 TaxID=3443737 RepID=UPI003F48F1B9